ncbi:MAG: protein phosphatase CheZ [Alphaproteobacteria bacterium]|nr:protein phosphatase CheZ [Alphaproteobacteria bacterium]
MTFSLDAASRAAPRKEFRAERSITPGRRAPRAAEPDALDGLDATSQMLLVRIEDLHQKIDSMAENRGQIGSEAIGEDDTVRLEIARLVKEIGRTKAELASLRHPMADEENDKISNATNELDAIVEATEHATHAILRNGEEIADLLARFRADSEIDDEHRIVLDQIEAKLIGIMESCNFQDITGQRITKVVNTMKFIEERVKAMIEVWGVDSFAHLPIPEDDFVDEDAKLLAGPQLEDQGLTQDDIDAMFD